MCRAFEHYRSPASSLMGPKQTIMKRFNATRHNTDKKAFLVPNFGEPLIQSKQSIICKWRPNMAQWQNKILVYSMHECAVQHENSFACAFSVPGIWHVFIYVHNSEKCDEASDELIQKNYATKQYQRLTWPWSRGYMTIVNGISCRALLIHNNLHPNGIWPVWFAVWRPFLPFKTITRLIEGQNVAGTSLLSDAILGMGYLICIILKIQETVICSCSMGLYLGIQSRNS